MTHKLQYKTEFQGLPISIETGKGQNRYWSDPFSGESGATKMKYPYGYVDGTLGTDGDAVDVFIGDDKDSERVFVITQSKKPEFEEIDEQKVMLGFSNPIDAKTAYLEHYNNARFFYTMKEMTIDEFKSKLESQRGRLIKSKLRKYSNRDIIDKQDSMLFLDINKAQKTPMKPTKPNPGSSVSDESDTSVMSKKFKSEDQRKYMHAAADRGEISEETVKEFEEKTPKNADLPEDVDKKDKSMADSVSKGTEELSNLQDIVKALKSTMLHGLSRKEQINAAYQYGMANGNVARSDMLDAEPVKLSPEEMNIGISKSQVRPSWEPRQLPKRFVPTPFAIPPKKCGDHVYRTPPAGPQEAKEFWKR